MSALADLLESRQQELLQRWTDAVRAHLSPGDESYTELRDHIPEYLRELVAALRREAPPQPGEAQAQVAREHGAQRFRLGFSLDAMVREYGLLRSLILDLVEESGCALGLREVRILTDFIATGIAEAVEEHTRRTERLLSQGEQEEGARLTALFEQAPAFIAHLHGPEHVFDMANSAYVRLMGGRSLLGKPIREALPELEGQPYYALLDRVYATGEAFTASEMPALLDRRGDGTVSEVLVDFVFQPTRGPDGQVSGILIHAVEVTEQVRVRQQVEAAHAELAAERARLVGVLESAPVAIVIVDATGRVLLSNKRAETELRQPTPVIHVPEDYRHWTAVRADGSPLPLEDYPLMRGLRGLSARGDLLDYRFPDGSQGTLEVAYGPVHDAHGQIIAALVIFADVTERRRTEAALRERAAFEQQLIGIVSHDLRSPLNAILLSTHALLRREDVDARTTKSVSRIQTSAERALRLVRDLLDFTQARLGGGLRLERRTLDLHETARAAVEEVAAAYPERTLQLQTQGEGRGEWDGDRLTQLLTNLVVNAVKYSPEGTPVTVRTAGMQEAVTLEVHNAGDPIAEALLPALFQPLQRGAGHTDSAQRSVGLGLYIVEQVVRAHGGRVEVRSTAEAGTTFTVHLPRRPPALPAQPSSDAGSTGAAPSGAPT